MAPTIFQAATLAFRASSAICPSSPSCPQDDQCTYAYNGASLQLSCATDYYGGDLQLTQTSTLALCLDACAKTSNCAAVSYVNQDCYLKSTLQAARANDNVIGAAVSARGSTTPTTSADPVACPATYTCPENDGCTIQGVGSRTFVPSCGIDFYGGDYYSNMGTASYEVCTQTCANDSQCIAASFVGGSGAGQCYLKDKNNGPNINDRVDAVAIDTRIVASTSATSSTATSSMTATSSVAVTSSDSSSATSSTSVSSSSAVSLSASSEVVVSTSSASLSALSSSPSPTSDLASSTLSSTSSVVLSSTISDVLSTCSVPLSTSSSSVVSSSSTPPAPTPSISSTSVTPTPTESSTSTSISTPTPTQILLNGGFEDGTANAPNSWTYSGALLVTASSGRQSTNPRTGTYSFQGQGLNIGGPWTLLLQQAITVVPGQAYSFSLWAKQAQAVNCLLFTYYNNALVGSGFYPSNAAFVQSIGSINAAMTTSTSGTVQIRAQCNRGYTTGRLWIDDVTVTAVQS